MLCLDPLWSLFAWLLRSLRVCWLFRPGPLSLSGAPLWRWPTHWAERRRSLERPCTGPHLREDLLTPRFYTTEIAKAARTELEGQRPAFEAMLGEMQADYNRDHFDRKAPLNRLHTLSAEQKEADESDLVRSCVSEFSGFLLFKELSC